MRKKLFNKFLCFLSYILVFVFFIFITLLSTVYLFCKGPSKKAQKLFVTTFLETGQMKFMPSLFLSREEIKKIVTDNSLKHMDAEINTSLINIDSKNNKELVEIHDVFGDNYEGKMLVLNDPSKISLATTYPFTEYGKTLDKIVKENHALAGANGGLYVSASNNGGMPLGVAVSNGEILKVDAYISGLYLIGFDEDNILRIISLEKLSESEIRNVIIKERIRDAVGFRDNTSDKNNHFVKLIINGEKRKLNGLGSGANPRTAIGQREDGTVLILVTDGRGKNGHLGATASDLIEVMEEYGAFNAANLDGGSSSSLYYNGQFLMTSVTFYYSNSSWRLPTAFIIKRGE